MKKHYDATKHISAHDLGGIIGLSHQRVSAKARRAGINPVRRDYAGGNLIAVFDRKEATEWAQSLVGDRTNVTPAADWNLMQRKPWKPCEALTANFQRAAEVYPHSLITPKGVGNGDEFQYGYARES